MELTIEQIAKIINAKEVVGDAKKVINGLNSFEDAKEFDLTYADNPKLLKHIEKTKALAVIVPENFSNETKIIVKIKNPRIAMTKLLDIFYPVNAPSYNIHPLSNIGDNFVFGKNVSIGPFVEIQNNVSLGDSVVIHSNSVIGNKVKIGNNTLIHPNVTILDGCEVGSRVIIHSGSVIGSDGFGFIFDNETNKHCKIRHLGIVQIDDDVEIGAGNTIDRATFGKTWIKSGVKTDNLVHIAHNVIVGENTLLVAQVGISGSVTIGKNVILAGQTGVRDHITIGDRVMAAGKTGIVHSIPPDQIISGVPEMQHDLWLKVQTIIPRLPELKNKIKELEERLSKLEKGEKHDSSVCDNRSKS